jgi:phage terminase Nu1 subunit (DNA packaging protein)
MTTKEFKKKVMVWVGAEKHLLLLDDSKPNPIVKKELQVLDEVQDFLKKLRRKEVVESTFEFNVREWITRRIKELVDGRTDKQGIKLGDLNKSDRDQLLFLYTLKDFLGL